MDADDSLKGIRSRSRRVPNSQIRSLIDCLQVTKTPCYATIELAFPDRQIAPAATVQLSPMLFVPLNVPVNLSLPIMAVGSRHSTPGASVPMPKAAVHENSKASARENDIWISGQIATMFRKTHACSDQGFTNALFWLGAARWNPRHNPTSHLGTERICHPTNSRESQSTVSGRVPSPLLFHCTFQEEP